MMSGRGTVAAFVIVAVAIVAGFVLLLTTQPPPVQITVNPPPPTPTPIPTETPSPLAIYVTGAVFSPQQTVIVAPGSRVADAIDAAGGTTDQADLDRVNLAGVMRDGDQVHVPAIGETANAQPTRSGGAVVNVNTATAEELETLPGIGPALSGRIIAYRDEFGAFADAENLMEVSGIGPATIERLGDLITFGN